MDAPVNPAAPPGVTAKTVPLWRSFLVFLAPMMLSNVLQSLSGTINNIFVGNMLGVDALAAATVFFPVLFFFMAFVLGLSTGATVLVGQAFGRGDMERVRAITGAALALTLLAGVVIGIVGAIFTRPLMVALATPADILEPAIAYARIFFLMMPLFFVFLLATSVLRGVGDTMTPLWTLVASTLVGLVLTPLFIVGRFGLPAMGVAGAAVAGLLSTLAALVWLAIHLRRKKHVLAPDAALFRHLKLDGKILALVLRIGVPTGVQMVIIAISELVLLGLVNKHGSEATAAYGAINQVLAYVQFPAMSIGIAASILGAQAIGAGRQAELWAITRTGLILNLIITGAGVAVCYLFSRAIISAFITVPAVVDLTEHLLHIVLWSVVIFGWAVVFSAMMRGSGTVLAPTALGILAVLGVEVPVAIYLSDRIGIDGIWWGYPACFCAMLVMQATWYTFVWRRRAIRALA